MAKKMVNRLGSPSGVLYKAAGALQDSLGDVAASEATIADGFMKTLELLECVAVDKAVYAAAKAVLLSNFRAVFREFLDGKTGMGVRRGAIKDVDIHAKNVLLHAWM